MWTFKIKRGEVDAFRLLDEISPKTERDGRSVIGSVLIDPDSPTEVRIVWSDGVSAGDMKWVKAQVRQCVRDHDRNAKTADEIEDEAEDAELAAAESHPDPVVAALVRMARRDRRRAVRARRRDRA